MKCNPNSLLQYSIIFPMVCNMTKIGRNKPCPCGSGKKYKNCCLKKDNYLRNLPNDALKRLKEEFSKYEQEDLIKTLAALSICPENQCQYIRLEIATQIACSNNNCGDEIITIQDLNELFLKYLPSKGPIGLLEDSLDTLFTNNILFFKNNVIFNGPATSDYYVLQKILNCIHLNSSSFSDDYMHYFYPTSMFILHLSDYIAKKSGHERYEVFDNRFRQEIFFPNINELNYLKNSLTLNDNELKGFMEYFNINEHIADDFIIEVGNDNFNSILSVEKEFKENLKKNIFQDFLKMNMYSEFSDKNPLLISPLIKIKNIYIIFPRLLPISLRHNLLSSLLKFNEEENFIKKYQQDLWSNILFNLKNKFHFEDFDDELPEWENTIFKDKVFKIDTDKLAYCILVNDNLKDYGKNGPCERIDLEYNPILKNRLDFVINNLYSDESINDILIILFMGMTGRLHYTEIPNYNNVLLINCEEFEILVNSGHYDSLTLFKFAKLLENKNIEGIGFLDKFSFYIEKNHSFYVTDEKMNVLLLPFEETSEYTKKLRKKAIKDKDPHLEIYNDVPIFVNKINDFMYAANHHLFLIKLINQNIWIKFEKDLETFIAKAIGFWIWQFSDELYKDFKPLNGSPILISFSLEEDKDLDLNIKITNNIKENLIISSNISEVEINFKISKYLIPIANQKNNEADLLLMDEILKLIGKLLEKNSLENTLTEERRREIIDEKSHSDLKKHMLIYTSEDINNIPVKNQIRLLQEHNVQSAMDGLVNKVQCEYDYNQKLTKDQSIELSHRIVGYYLDCIKKEIVKYDWDDLIQKLILNYENILFARSSFNNVYYFNNYDNDSSILEEIVYEEHELDKMGLPTRFLIEILSAEQKSNSKIKISKESFDHLMALSCNYIDWAFSSDYIKSEHVDFEITPLESGRFGTKTNLDDILDTFRTNRTLEHMNNLSVNIFHENDGGERPSIDEEEAFESEFGINLTDYAEFISVLISLGVDYEKDIVFISKSKLINILKKELNWESDKSEQAIENFSLKHRPKWDIPPEDYCENDIHPWVFRRPLSYHLKPLIIKNDNDETVIYGFRNVYHSILNLLHLIYKGLYKTDNSSKKFKKFIGKMSDIKGKEFNERVFKWFEDNLDTSEKFYLKQNVKIDKIVKIEPKYGDIDILLLDNNKKHLLSIECKDIEGARNPREIFHEIEKFFDNKEWIKKHQRREIWIKNNLDKLGNKIGHDLKDYKVFSFFIVSQELPVIYLKETPIPILPFSQIKNDGLSFLDK